MAQRINLYCHAHRAVSARWCGQSQSTGLEKTKRLKIGGNTSFTHGTPKNTKLKAGSQDFFEATEGFTWQEKPKITNG
ncbi:MAG: hypothetical protein ACREOI_09420 [bacterium]